MIIGLISAFQEVFVREARLGRFVANLELERALLTSSRAQELHFFFPTTTARSMFQKVFSEQIRARQGVVRLFTFVELPSCLREFDYTSLHQADLISYYPALAFVRNRFAPRVPLTAVTHTISYREIISENFKKLLPGPMPFDAVIATSRTAVEVIRKNLDQLTSRFSDMFRIPLSFTGQVVRIPLGVDTELYLPRNQTEARARMGWPAGAFVALSLGRLNYFEKMDLLPLIRLWTEIIRLPGPDQTILILAGSDDIGYAGLLKEQIQALGLEGSVRVQPNPSHAAKVNLLAGADVFLSLVDNVQETFGLSVIEAQAAGLPVLVSDFNGYKDLVDPGRTGYLVPTAWAPDHPETIHLAGVLLSNVSHLVQSQGTIVSLSHLRKGLATLKADRKKRGEMGQQAREWVKRFFDWKVVIRAYEDLWSNLKDQARKYDGPPGQQKDPFAFSWAGLFGPYPSTVLSRKERLFLTPFGRQYLAEQERPVMYSDVSPLLSSELLKSLAAALGSVPRSVGELRSRFRGIDSALMEYHLHWLIKNHLIEIETPEKGENEEQKVP